jgi:CelD/BcsL family acetyltransferase involved in cellulose biosynthesis
LLAARFDVQILRTVRDLERVEVEWERCFQADANASPYASFEWVHCLAEMLRKDSELRVCIIRNKGHTVAIMPLARAKKELRLPYVNLQWMTIPYLQWLTDISWLGGTFSTHNTAIIHPDAQGLPIFDVVVSRLLDQRDFFFIKLLGVPSDNTILPRSNSGETPAGTSSKLAVDRAPVGRSVVIEVTPTWDDYCGTLSPAHRKTVARRSKAFHKRGKVRLVRLGLDPADDPAAVAALTDDAILVSRKSWQGNASFGIAISDEPVVNFVRAVSLRLAHRGNLDLSVLYLDDRPVSFVWGAARWPLTTISKLAFDPAYRELAPGVVHLAMLIRDSISRRGSAIDFGHQFADYKMRWSKQTRDISEVTCYRPSIMSTLVQSALHLRNIKRAWDCGKAPERSCGNVHASL